MHVVRQPVQQDPGQPFTLSKHLRPIRKGQVRRHDQTRLLVALTEEAEQVFDHQIGLALDELTPGQIQDLLLVQLGDIVGTVLRAPVKWEATRPAGHGRIGL